MASEKTILIQGTEDLARGEMDNVTLDGGAVVLEQAEGRYVLFGCYTTPAFSVPVSGELLVSWNADTPEGTVVEIQARVLAHDEWSGWALENGAPICSGRGSGRSRRPGPMCRAAG